MIITLLAATLAFAQYQVETAVYVDKKLIANRVSTLGSGASEEFHHQEEGDTLYFKVSARSLKKGAVQVSYNIDYKTADNFRVHASPRITALPGDKSVVVQQAEGKKELKIETMVRNLNDLSQVVPGREKVLGEEIAAFKSEGDYLEDLELSEE